MSKNPEKYGKGSANQRTPIIVIPNDALDMSQSESMEPSADEIVSPSSPSRTTLNNTRANRKEDKFTKRSHPPPPPSPKKKKRNPQPEVEAISTASSTVATPAKYEAKLNLVFSSSDDNTSNPNLPMATAAIVNSDGRTVVAQNNNNNNNWATPHHNNHRTTRSHVPPPPPRHHHQEHPLPPSQPTIPRADEKVTDKPQEEDPKTPSNNNNNNNNNTTATAKKLSVRDLFCDPGLRCYTYSILGCCFVFIFILIIVFAVVMADTVSKTNKKDAKQITFPPSTTAREPDTVPPNDLNVFHGGGGGGGDSVAITDPPSPPNPPEEPDFFYPTPSPSLEATGSYNYDDDDDEYYYDQGDDFAAGTCTLCSDGSSVGAPFKIFDFEDGTSASCQDIENVYSFLTTEECNDFVSGGVTDFYQSYCECPFAPTGCTLCEGNYGNGFPSNQDIELGDGQTYSCTELEELYLWFDEDTCFDFSIDGTTDTLAEFCQC